MNRLSIIAAFFALVFIAGHSALARSGYDLFQKGLVQERTEGDLEEAIRLYKQIVAKYKDDRALVAKALLQMGRCYEKLGKKEAQKAYQRLIKEFADQSEIVAQARVRLSKLSSKDDKAAPTKSTRQVWAPAHDAHGRISPNGRYISYVNWSQGNLALHDLKTGENRDLTNKGTYEEEPSQMADESLWSPDSRQIAYAWSVGKWFDLRIVGIDGSAPRILCSADPGKRQNAPFPLDWSQDGKHILAELIQGGEHHIVLVSVEDGSVRTLKSLGTQNPGRMTLSPDGRYVAYDLTVEPGSKARNIHILATDGSLDAPLVEHPGLDMWPFWTPDGKRVLFRSDRSGALGLWLLDVMEGRAQGHPTAIHEISNDSRALGFTQDGSFYYTIYKTNTDVYGSTLDLETGMVLSPPTKTSQRFEGSNHAPVWSSDGKQLAYFSNRGRANPHILVVRSLETGEERDVSLQSGLELYRNPAFGLPQWSRDGRSILVRGWTKVGPGLFLVDVETGGFTALLQDKPEDEEFLGWPVFSKNGKTVYYVRGPRPDRQPAIVARDVESGNNSELYRAAQGISLGFLALSPDGRRLAFGEKEKEEKIVLKTMPISGGEPREVLTVQKSVRFHLVRDVGVSWTPDGNHLVMGRPGQRTQLWVVPVDGGETRTVKLGAYARGLRLHPDGRRIAFTGGQPQGDSEVWVLENFLPSSISQDDLTEYIKAKNWEAAASIALRLVEQLPESGARTDKINTYAAAVLVLAGDKGRYRAFCEDRVAEYGSNPIRAGLACKICLLMPGAIELDRLPVALLDKAIYQEQGRGWKPQWNYAARALVAYRSGDAAAALRYVRAQQEKSRNEPARAFGLAILALAQHGIGKSDEARATLDALSELLASLDPTQQNWLATNILRTEAEALLAAKPKASKSR